LEVTSFLDKEQNGGLYQRGMITVTILIVILVVKRVITYIISVIK